MTTSNIDIVKAYLEAASRHDFPAMQAYFTEDFVYRVPGGGPLSGVFTRQTAAFDYVGRIMALTDGNYAITDFIDWLESSSRVALISREKIVRLGETFEWTRIVVFSFRENRFNEISLFDDDLKGLDALLLK